MTLWPPLIEAPRTGSPVTVCADRGEAKHFGGNVNITSASNSDLFSSGKLPGSVDGMTFNVTRGGNPSTERTFEWSGPEHVPGRFFNRKRTGNRLHDLLSSPNGSDGRSRRIEMA